MSIIKVDYGTVGGGIELNPSMAKTGNSATNVTYTVDLTKKYIISAVAKYNDNVNRIQTYYVDEGTITNLGGGGTGTSYFTLSISGATLTLNFSSGYYHSYSIVILD